MDWIISALSLTAKYLFIKKKSQGWILSALANLMFLRLNYVDERYGLMPIGVLGFLMCIKGYREWR